MAEQLSQLDPVQLSQMPTVPPPPGEIVDFDKPNPQEIMIITVISVFIGLAILFVGIRAYTKAKQYSRRSWDDGEFYVDATPER